MQKLAEICVRRPVFATMLILSITVVGLFSFRSLGVDLFPKIDLPTITITVVNPGASPQEIETEITDKVEGAVNTISGIDELRSTSVEGVSQVFVNFVLEKNADERMHPSSMSKLMTMYVVFDMLKKGRLQLDQQLPVSERASN